VGPEARGRVTSVALATGARDTGYEPIISPLSRRMAIEASGYLPRRVHLPGARAIVDQQGLECCVSCTMGAAVEILLDSSQRAPLYHYFVVCEGTGRVSRSQGMTFEEGQLFLSGRGICSCERHPVPYTPDGARVAPSPAAETDALALARRLPDLLQPFELLVEPLREIEWKRKLAEGRPLTIEFRIGPDYHEGMRRLTDESASGPLHAVVVLGYDDEQSAFIVQDSRGVFWGLGGQWWLPYEVANTRRVKRALALRPGRR
jgi:hypothetical protein